MQDSTIRSYALEETRLLCFVLQCLQADRYSIGDSASLAPSPEGLYIGLTKHQVHCFEALLQHSVELPQPLEPQNEPFSKLDLLIDAALRSVYMPGNSLEMFENVF